jgi:hypothetical protein
VWNYRGTSTFELLSYLSGSWRAPAGRESLIETACTGSICDFLPNKDCAKLPFRDSTVRLFVGRSEVHTSLPENQNSTLGAGHPF